MTAACPTGSVVPELAAAVRALQAASRPSAIADHGADCCALARTWLERLDASLHHGRARGAPPAWIARRWVRAADGDAVHWCEIVAGDALGEHAAGVLARELWARRTAGILGVELIQRADGAPAAGPDRTPGGGALIPRADGAPAAGPDRTPGVGRLAYREAVGRSRRERLDVWDASGGAWLPAPYPRGGGALSVRVSGGAPEVVRWGAHALTTVVPGGSVEGAWTALGGR
jgi:hypothetical protein